MKSGSVTVFLQQKNAVLGTAESPNLPIIVVLLATLSSNPEAIAWVQIQKGYLVVLN